MSDRRISAGFFSHPIVLGTIGALCLGLSVDIAQDHVRVVMAVKDTSVPLLATLPKLEHRSKVLQEQVDLAQLHAAMRVG